MRSQKGRLADTAIRQGPEDKGYFEIYLEWRKLCEVEYPNLRIMSFPSFYRLKPFQVKSDVRQECCVCVYHRQAALYVRSLNGVRRLTHDRLSWTGTSLCQFTGKGCNCDCLLCLAPVTNYLTPFMDTMLCKREKDSAHYRLGCVLGKCPDCGWDKVQGACQTDLKKDKTYKTPVPVRILQDVIIDQPDGRSKRVKIEQTTMVLVPEFRKEMKNYMTNIFAIHDYVARWQASQFRLSMSRLNKGQHVWIFDYIENFSCFSKIELQQDYFNKRQIGIFIVLVIRHRRPEESLDTTVSEVRVIL